MRELCLIKAVVYMYKLHIYELKQQTPSHFTCLEGMYTLNKPCHLMQRNAH